MSSTITYQDRDREPVTVSLGVNYNVTREGACMDVHLERALAIDCPLKLTILIRTDGTIAEWSAVFDPARANTYWHFASDPTQAAPTPAQLKTLAGIYFGRIKPFGVTGTIGKPVCVWAFRAMTLEQLEALGNEGNRGFYTVPMARG